MLRWSVCDYSDTYIIIRGTITVTNCEAAEQAAIILIKRWYLQAVLHLLAA